MKTYEFEYMDTEYRVFGIEVEANNEDDAYSIGCDVANESYHGIREVLCITLIKDDDNH